VQEVRVRTLVRIIMDMESGNAAIQNGTLGQMIGDAMERLKPEASYFYAEGGKRTALLVIDMKDQSDIPMIAEPFFIGAKSSVEFFPVMNADDLQIGLAKFNESSSKERELSGV
jgi:hypothetical protein